MTGPIPGVGGGGGGGYCLGLNTLNYIHVMHLDKTRQDNVLFGVLYSPMYIDFIQII